MTTASTIALLKAYLLKEGLTICKASDTQYPLDGFKEHEALNGIIELIEDTFAMEEWAPESSDQDITKKIAPSVLEQLKSVA
jgi:hypothetical protein